MKVEIGSSGNFFSFVLSEKQYFNIQEITEIVQKELPNTEPKDIRIYNDQSYGRIIAVVEIDKKISETTR